MQVGYAVYEEATNRIVFATAAADYLCLSRIFRIVIKTITTQL